MALTTSGPLSISDIYNEINPGDNNYSLASLSQTAGFTTPYNIGAFYGYSNAPAADPYFFLSLTGYYSAELTVFDLPNGFSEFTEVYLTFTFNVFDYEERDRYEDHTRGRFRFDPGVTQATDSRISRDPERATSIVSIDSWYFRNGGDGLDITDAYF